MSRQGIVLVEQDSELVMSWLSRKEHVEELTCVRIVSG